MHLAHRRGQKAAGDLARDFSATCDFAAAIDDADSAIFICSCHGYLILFQGLRRTRASMKPCGSSVGTKIWFGLSWPNRERSTRRQCLFGIVISISSISEMASSALSAIA